MCEPLTIAATTLQVAQHASEFMGEQQAAKAQTAYYNDNATRARTNAYAQMGQIDTLAGQEAQASAQDIFDKARETRAALATARVASGEAGVSGISVDALLSDTYGQGLRATDRISQNNSWTQAQRQLQKKGIASDAETRINSVRPGVNPSFLGTALKIGSSVVGGVQSYKNSLPPKG